MEHFIYQFTCFFFTSQQHRTTVNPYKLKPFIGFEMYSSMFECHIPLSPEMSTSGDLKSGDQVSNYPTRPPEERPMRPPPHQIYLHAPKLT